MNMRYRRSLMRRSLGTILVSVGLLPALVAPAQTPPSQPRRFLSPSVEEIIEMWRQPPRMYSQAPFWFWNGPLDPNTMRRQVRMMADKGVHAALPHPRFGMDRKSVV